jgi:O-antigen/teichoic acid export membrane protein
VADGISTAAKSDNAPGQNGDDYAQVTRSVASSGLWSIVGQACGLVASLLATPFTIRFLGPARYGVWSLLQTCMNWIGLADLGMFSASTRFAGESLAARDDAGEARAVWVATCVAVATTTTASLAAAVAAVPIVDGLLRITGALRAPAVEGLRILCVLLVAQAVAGTFNTPQQIRLRWRSYTAITVGPQILAVVLIPMLLKAVGGGIVTACFITAAAAVVTAVATIIIACRLQPALARPRFSTRMLRKLLLFGGWLTIAGIVQIPLTTAERFALAHYRSASEVAYYMVASRLAGLLAAIPMAVAAPLYPTLVRLNSVSDHTMLRRLYSDALMWASVVLTPAAIVLAFVAHPFFSIWAGAIYGQSSTGPFYLLVTGVWISSLAYMPYSYLMAASQTQKLAWVRVGELVPYLAGVAVLTRRWGASGAALAWSLRQAVDAVMLFALARRHGRLTWLPFSNRRVRSAAAPFALCLCALALSPVTDAPVVRLLTGALMAGVYVVIIWRAVLDRSERDRFSRLVVRLRPRLRT